MLLTASACSARIAKASTAFHGSSGQRISLRSYFVEIE